jgi:hypothetical protein
VNSQTTTAAEAQACGVTGPAAATFNFQVNTVNYIVGGCMESVIDQSGLACGGLHNPSCVDGLMMLSSFGETGEGLGQGCVCVHDPSSTFAPGKNAPACFYAVSGEEAGTINVHCNQDSAGDPVAIYQETATGGWSLVYDYPGPGPTAYPMIHGVAAGATDVFLGCTFLGATAPVGPGKPGCDAIPTPVSMPTPPPPPPPCVPLTCGASDGGPALCGTQSDGCGGVLNCPPCACVPTTTCASLHANCATVDNCGNPLGCGVCGGDAVCSHGTCCAPGLVGGEGVCCPATEVVSNGHCCPSGEEWVGKFCVHLDPPPPPPKCTGLCQ